MKKKGRIVPRHITLAVKNDEELNKLLGGTKKREPDHTVAYASSGGYGNEYEASEGGHGELSAPFFGTTEVKHGEHGRVEAPAPCKPSANLELN